MVLRLDAEAVKQACRVGFRFPAVHLREFPFQLAGPDAVLIGKILLRVDGFLFLHDLVQTGVSHDDRVQHRELVVFKMILFQHGKTLAGGDDHLAAGGLQLAGQDL